MTELEIVTAVLIGAQAMPPVEIAAAIVQLGIVIAAAVVCIKAIRELRNRPETRR